MQEHGTTLTDGSFVSFMAAGAKAFARLGLEFDPDVVRYWGRNHDENLYGIIYNALRDAVVFGPRQTTTLPATTERFVARGSFNSSCVHTDLGFDSWCLPKVEKPRSEVTLQYADLLQSSPLDRVCYTLGEQAETKLVDVLTLVHGQYIGMPLGPLLVDKDKHNVFLARDSRNILRAMTVRWNSWFWLVSAHQIRDSRLVLFKGTRVFSSIKF